ncbi:MAG: hypothetical protein IPH16_03975 [Haliscomenobacter sp.]|nr:hypothetical protein [Haliscomenobacter sp.]
MTGWMMASLVFRLATLAQLAYWALLFRKLAFYRQVKPPVEEKKKRSRLFPLLFAQRTKKQTSNNIYPTS